METCPVCGAMMALHNIEQVSRCNTVLQLGRIATALEAVGSKIGSLLEGLEYDREEGRGPWRGDYHG